MTTRAERVVKVCTTRSMISGGTKGTSPGWIRKFRSWAHVLRRPTRIDEIIRGRIRVLGEVDVHTAQPRERVLLARRVDYHDVVHLLGLQERRDHPFDHGDPLDRCEQLVLAESSTLPAARTMATGDVWRVVMGPCYARRLRESGAWLAGRPLHGIPGSAPELRAHLALAGHPGRRTCPPQRSAPARADGLVLVARLAG